MRERHKKNGKTHDIRVEYPPELIRAGERGKYEERYQEGTYHGPVSRMLSRNIHQAVEEMHRASETRAATRIVNLS